MAQIYISTGSNLGDRLNFLQQGLDAVAKRVGKVIAVSSVVETTALGFEGNSFLNACFSVETNLPPKKVMQILLEIEKKHGRTRNTAMGYQNRTLDLDMLFYDDLVLNDAALTLPHPSMEKRRFVLLPLAEIAPDKIHPITKKSMEELLVKCEDKTVPIQTQYSLT